MSLPPWLRKAALVTDRGLDTLRQLRINRVHTVCEEAKCPNIGECFSQRCVTFMILGDVCTRNCAFCGVSKDTTLPPDPSEPVRIAQAAESLSIRYCVITSVTRDDLPDGGALQFARSIDAVKSLGGTVVEVLVPDFGGSRRSIETVLRSSPAVVAHNLETVPRLYRDIRPGAAYKRSLGLLKLAKSIGGPVTKSGLILGLGEKTEEVLCVMEDLRESGCDVITLGQYLPPTGHHLQPAEYVRPERFDEYRREALQMGFRSALAGPFVRSSFHAAEAYAVCTA
jgi:lipoic acid synthetase